MHQSLNKTQRIVHHCKLEYQVMNILGSCLLPTQESCFPTYIHTFDKCMSPHLFISLFKQTILPCPNILDMISPLNSTDVLHSHEPYSLALLQDRISPLSPLKEDGSN